MNRTDRVLHNPDRSCATYILISKLLLHLLPRFILMGEARNYLGMMILPTSQAHQTFPASTCLVPPLEGETREFNTISLSQGSSS